MDYKKEFEKLLLSKERNRKKKKYFPDYWLHRNYLQQRAYDLAFKFFFNTITEQEKYLTTVAQPNRKEFWISRGYSEDESRLKVSLHQSNNNKKYLQKYTPEERKKFQNTSIEYYLNKGYELNEAKKLLNQRQSTFSLTKCVEKYGKEKGSKIFQERQNKWQNTLNKKSDEELKEMNNKKGITLPNYVSKYGDEEGTKRYYLWLEEYLQRLQRNGFKRYSKESIDFFNKHFPETIIQKSQFGEDEYFLRDGDKTFFYDFKYKNVIVEYHGSVYHFNPMKDDVDTWFNPFGIKPQESLEKDERKKSLAKNHNFKYFEIYSNDDDVLKKSKIQQILEALHEEDNN